MNHGASEIFQLQQNLVLQVVSFVVIIIRMNVLSGKIKKLIGLWRTLTQMVGMSLQHRQQLLNAQQFNYSEVSTSLELAHILPRHLQTFHLIRELEFRLNSGRLILGMMKEPHCSQITEKFGDSITCSSTTSSLTYAVLPDGKIKSPISMYKWHIQRAHSLSNLDQLLIKELGTNLGVLESCTYILVIVQMDASIAKEIEKKIAWFLMIPLKSLQLLLVANGQILISMDGLSIRITTKSNQQFAVM